MQIGSLQLENGSRFGQRHCLGERLGVRWIDGYFVMRGSQTLDHQQSAWSYAAVINIIDVHFGSPGSMQFDGALRRNRIGRSLAQLHCAQTRKGQARVDASSHPRMLKRACLFGNDLRKIIKQLADANEPVFVAGGFSFQTFEHEMSKCAVAAAPSIVLKASFVSARRKQAHHSRAALADFIKVLGYESPFSSPTRRPSELSGVASIGHQYNYSGVKPLGDDSVKL